MLERLIPYSILGLSLLMLLTPVEHRAPTNSAQKQSKAIPPGPPVLENFQANPQLSLFPRLGDFRPEDGEDRLPFWHTYREHLLKISGVIETDSASGNRAFAFRGIKGIDSVGHFAPLAVEPDKNYSIELRMNAKLPEGETTGVGILEYKDFLWVAEQYPESLHQQLYLNTQELLRLNKTDSWQKYRFSFRTGPETRMIHLVLFREGPASSREPVLIDDIAVTEE